ncbi:hypothetical protein NUSPORA_02495 [Nucleospora cyclopteri]
MKDSFSCEKETNLNNKKLTERKTRSFADIFELGEIENARETEKSPVLIDDAEQTGKEDFNLLDEDKEEATSVIGSIFSIFKKKKVETPQFQPKVFKKQEIQKPTKERVILKNNYAGKKDVNISIPGLNKKE